MASPPPPARTRSRSRSANSDPRYLPWWLLPGTGASTPSCRPISWQSHSPRTSWWQRRHRCRCTQADFRLGPGAPCRRATAPSLPRTRTKAGKPFRDWRHVRTQVRILREGRRNGSPSPGRHGASSSAFRLTVPGSPGLQRLLCLRSTPTARCSAQHLSCARSSRYSCLPSPPHLPRPSATPGHRWGPA